MTYTTLFEDKIQTMQTGEASKEKGGAVNSLLPLRSKPAQDVPAPDSLF